MNSHQVSNPIFASPWLSKGTILLGIWLAFACGKTESTQDDQAEQTVESSAKPVTTQVTLTTSQNEHLGVELGSVVQRPLRRIIKVNGQIDVPPQSLISVSAPMGGFFKSTPLLPGTRVRKGEVIAVMENSEYIQLQQDYLDSKAQLELARLDFERQRDLNRENVNAAKVYQQATATYQLLQNRVKALAEKLNLLGIKASNLTTDAISSTITILSPIPGYIKTVNMNPGRYVNPTDVLFEIVNPEHMHLALSVFEKDLPGIKEGQRVVFTLPNQPGRERLGEVHLIGKAVSEDKTVPIHAHILKDDPDLVLGMYVNARIESGVGSTNALPDDAFVSDEGKEYIFILKPDSKGEYQKVEVQKGVSENGYTAVQLPPSLDVQTARIVVKGAHSLLGILAKETEVQ